jgi:imidazolonepropionase-like amidohydrolase
MKVVRGGRLIDGTGAGPVGNATIVVRDGRIAEVTTRSGGDWPAEAEIIDAAGMTILPGLIDCHDHLGVHGYDLARRWGIDEPQSTRTLRTAKVLADTLAAGYTAVRDAAGLDAGFKRAIEEGLIPGRGSSSRSRSSRRSAASATAPAPPVSPAACRTTRCCRTASSTASPMSARWCGAWCAPAPT